MSAARQLGLDLTPAATVAVGQRVRVLATAGTAFSLVDVRSGDAGTVVDVRRPCGPADLATWLPVVVVLDRRPERRFAYAFNHEDLEAVQ